SDLTGDRKQNRGKTERGRRTSYTSSTGRQVSALVASPSTPFSSHRPGNALSHVRIGLRTHSTHLIWGATATGTISLPRAKIGSISLPKAHEIRAGGGPAQVAALSQADSASVATSNQRVF